MKSNSIVIFTDGSSLGNPGPGGYGCVLVFQDSEKVIELGGYERTTTNNRMELTAIMTALNYLKEMKTSSSESVVIHTDSSYAINGITKWMFGWQNNNWITSTKTPVLNTDIWKELVNLSIYFKNLSFVHVKGHAGIVGNERCDAIATSFSSKKEVTLFIGKLSDYDPGILSLKPLAGSSTSSSTSKNTGKAYSYISFLDNKIEIHKTWDECKARVNGKPARYQKVFSKSEEDELIKKWKTI